MTVDGLYCPSLKVHDTGGCSCGGRRTDPHRADCVARRYLIVVYDIGNTWMFRWMSLN